MLIKGILVGDNLNGYVGDGDNKREAYRINFDDQSDLLKGDDWVERQFELVTGASVDDIGLWKDLIREKFNYLITWPARWKAKADYD
ncbi:hypothetical protein FGB62_27g29 [Gracilaria domingensis]|nr:hypothetical protein FGB62_27g29 [Gracilaria domingensis]